MSASTLKDTFGLSGQSGSAIKIGTACVETPRPL